jgi:hypothetical protein
MELNLLRQKKKKIHKYETLRKIHQMGADLFHAERRTDTWQSEVTFRQFANAPKKASNFLVSQRLLAFQDGLLLRVV